MRRKKFIPKRRGSVSTRKFKSARRKKTKRIPKYGSARGGIRL